MTRFLLLAVVFALISCGEGQVPSTPEGAPGSELTDSPPVRGEVAVAAVEYQFHGVPSELTSGPYTLRLENEGQEQH